ncbi:hypothetical protein EH31_04935 [Erythrobacter longus]|uniref:Uncharacterized protein n=1 Tax=Erythrobacter longus TaxID=1044 RepID=A0A074MGR1_ERYLO|nr:helix-hairpin-helix domain-containing protein [Erythrobacter longus]KEO92020.1 hypothetical protein EH31_04935 [Erythrobacter longus]
MPATFQEALPFILLGLALLVALWIIFRASRKTKVIGEKEGDVLDDGAGPAARNQALIDAPRSVEINTGETSALANSDAVAAAPAIADAEAGASVPATRSVPEAAASPSPAASAGDDLKRIKGVGPKLVTMLAEQGITTFEQIASWSEADIERMDAGLGRFQGRITRDKWVEQAKLLAAGDESGFSATFGNNG